MIIGAFVFNYRKNGFTASGKYIDGTSSKGIIVGVNLVMHKVKAP